MRKVVITENGNGNFDIDVRQILSGLEFLWTETAPTAKEAVRCAERFLVPDTYRGPLGWVRRWRVKASMKAFGAGEKND